MTSLLLVIFNPNSELPDIYFGPSPSKSKPQKEKASKKHLEPSNNHGTVSSGEKDYEAAFGALYICKHFGGAPLVAPPAFSSLPLQSLGGLLTSFELPSRFYD
jgi:hypothetical protein